nr:uncharacterized protein LOC118682928 [Bactrocera oleae]
MLKRLKRQRRTAKNIERYMLMRTVRTNYVISKLVYTPNLMCTRMFSNNFDITLQRINIELKQTLNRHSSNELFLNFATPPHHYKRIYIQHTHINTTTTHPQTIL